MGLFSSKTPEQKAAGKAAVKKYNKAMDELERVSKRDRKHPDDAVWNKANDAANEAAKSVSWWHKP